VEQRTGDASDADRRVIAEQLRYDLGDIAWRPVDASGTAEETLAAAREAVEAATLKRAE
jgi:hypothetical protein